VARKLAPEFYDDLLLRKAQGIPLTDSPNFVKAYEDLIKADQRRVDGGKRKKSMVF